MNLTRILSAEEGVLRDNVQLRRRALIPMVGPLLRRLRVGDSSVESLRCCIEGRGKSSHASQHRRLHRFLRIEGTCKQLWSYI